MKKLTLVIIIAIFATGCKEKYERPDHYTVDLFKNRNEQIVDSLLTPEEAFGKSLAVLKTDEIKLVDSSLDKANKVFIYGIYNGKFLKQSSDTLSTPFHLISDYRLTVNADSLVIYIDSLKSYKLIAKPMKIKYQSLKKAPAQ